MDGIREAEERQVRFDERMDRIFAEGEAAFGEGCPRDPNPYDGDPEPHARTAWSGGWAMGALRALDPGHGEDASPAPGAR